jgi:hypothetical protein
MQPAEIDFNSTDSVHWVGWHSFCAQLSAKRDVMLKNGESMAE